MSEQHSWQCFNSLRCPLILTTNNRCVQSLNISVDVDKYLKMFTNSTCSLTFCPLENTTCRDWTIYSWQGFNSIGCPLMLRTNCRCVQSLNISVTSPNVWKMNSMVTHICPQKKTCPDWTIYSWQGFNSLGCPLMLRICRCFQSTQHQCRCRQICGKCSQIHQVHSLLSITCPNWTIYSWQSFNS